MINRRNFQLLWIERTWSHRWDSSKVYSISEHMQQQQQLIVSRNEKVWWMNLLKMLLSIVERFPFWYGKYLWRLLISNRTHRIQFFFSSHIQIGIVAFAFQSDCALRFYMFENLKLVSHWSLCIYIVDMRSSNLYAIICVVFGCNRWYIQAFIALLYIENSSRRVLISQIVSVFTAHTNQNKAAQITCVPLNMPNKAINK